MKIGIIKYLLICLLQPSLFSAINNKLNVLFIGADDLRMNLGCYGDKLSKTPNLDALAREGVIFKRAYIQFASCNASRTSMLTGLRPDTSKVYSLKTNFRKKVPSSISLPQYFKNHGYHTESIGKVYHNYNNIKDPHAWSLPARLDQISHFRDYVVESNIKADQKKSVATESSVDENKTYLDDKVTVDAIQTIERLKSLENPFFLAVGFYKPHSPYNAPKRFWDLYKREDMLALGPLEKPKKVPEQNWFYPRELRTFTDVPSEGPLPDDIAKRLRHGYYAATSYMDDNVGQLINALKENDLYENTIIVFWSDHGYHLGENSHWTKVTLRELDTHVPLICRIPGKKHFASSAIVEYIDIYPTLTDLCKLPKPKNIDGKSFGHIFNKPLSLHKPYAVSQVTRPWLGQKKLGTQMGYSIRTQKQRYTWWLNLKTKKVVAEELYDTENDLLERNNLIQVADKNVLEEFRKIRDKF